MEVEPLEPNRYLDKFSLVGIPDVSTLTTLPNSACSRGKVSTNYGQNLYLSDVSDDEVGTAIVGRKRRSNHIRSPTFADQFTPIIYDCTEEYITVKADVVSKKPVPNIIAVSIRTKNDSSQRDILARNRAQNSAFGWTSSQYDSVPDTKNPQESSLGFPRKTVWNIARTIGRARAVYARFLFLISALGSMSECDVPLELYARHRVSVHGLEMLLHHLYVNSFSLCSKSIRAYYLL